MRLCKVQSYRFVFLSIELYHTFLKHETIANILFDSGGPLHLKTVHVSQSVHEQLHTQSSIFLRLHQSCHVSWWCAWTVRCKWAFYTVFCNFLLMLKMPSLLSVWLWQSPFLCNLHACIRLKLTSLYFFLCCRKRRLGKYLTFFPFIFHCFHNYHQDVWASFWKCHATFNFPFIDWIALTLHWAYMYILWLFLPQQKAAATGRVKCTCKQQSNNSTFTVIKPRVSNERILRAAGVGSGVTIGLMGAAPIVVMLGKKLWSKVASKFQSIPRKIRRPRLREMYRRKPVGRGSKPYKPRQKPIGRVWAAWNGKDHVHFRF
jgi:hypothetical protein